MRICFCLAWVSLAAVLGANDSQPMRRITSVVRSDVRSGKLVRSSSVSSHAVASTVIAPTIVSAVPPAPEKPERKTGTPSNIDEAVERIAAQHALPPALLHAVIKVESNYNPYAVSSKGAQGLMQLIPSTARRFGVTNVFNPVENIQGGAKYLRYLLDLFGRNYPLALAAYNAGEANVARFGGVPPFAETRNYVVLVREQLRRQQEANRRALEEQARRNREAERQAKPAENSSEPPVNHITEVVSGDGTVRYVTR